MGRQAVVTLSAAGVAAAIALVAALIMTSGAAATGSYAPTLAVEHCNGLSASFPPSAPFTDSQLAGNPSCTGANPTALNSALNLTVKQNVPSGHLNPGSPLFVSGPGDDYVAPDSSITNGTKAGGVSMTAAYTLLNGSCSTVFSQDYILYEATTSNSNTIDPLDYSDPDHLSNLATDSNPLDGFADPGSPFVGSNPSFYPVTFDPDLDAPFGINGPAPPVQPVARYTGMSKLHASLGGAWTMLSVFVFNSSDLAPFAAYEHNNPHPLARLGRAPGDGRVYVAILDDPLESPAGESTVIRACAPITTTAMLLGTLPNAEVRARTPTTSGTRGFGAWSYSERNADGDSIGNWLDTCPFNTNSGDTDGDGLDNACDPTPSVNTNSGDHDGDGFLNRDDNCPLVANWPQSSEREMEMYYVTAAPNGGPRGDGIGNHCDPNQFTGYSQGDHIESYALVPKCFGGTDADGDRYCSTQDPNDNNASVKGFTLNKGPDQDGLPYGDKFGANLELYVGTDVHRACNRTTASSDEAVDAWPADFDDNGRINIGDVLALKPVFGGSVPAVSSRYDISPSKTINIGDVLAIKPVFLMTCGITMRVDAEPQYEIANTATLIGSPETCREAPVSAIFDIDVTATAIPAVGGGSGGIDGFDFTFTYDPSKLQINAVNYSMLLAANGGSLTSFGDSVFPDTDGTLNVAVADIGSATAESGTGVLARITVQTMANGSVPLTIAAAPTSEIRDSANVSYPVRPIGATVAVGTASCP